MVFYFPIASLDASDAANRMPPPIAEPGVPAVPDIPISYPGRFAPGFALAYADAAGAALQVSSTTPLPVAVISGGSAGSVPPALSGSSAVAITAGPFAPLVGRPLVLALSGTWTGTAKLLRSTDGGITRLPLSLGGSPYATFATNICEPVWEENEAGATFYLQLAPTSGTILYRLAQ